MSELVAHEPADLPIDAGAEKVERKPTGAWSLFATVSIIVIAAYCSGGFSAVVRDIPAFFSAQLEHQALVPGEMLGTALATIVIAAALAIVSAVLLQKRSADNLVESMLLKKKEQGLFMTVVLTVLGEELFARGLFLGLLYQVPWFHNPVGFYLLLLLGNGLWSAVHLLNYKGKTPGFREVVPQFLAGIPMAYFFCKYGFVPVLTVHLAYDAMLFTGMKVQNTDRKDLLLILLGAVYTIVGIGYLHHSILEVAPWFNGGSYVLEGWSFIDYVALYLVVDGVTDVLFGVLLYDRNGLQAARQLREKVAAGSTGRPVLHGAIEVVAAALVGAAMACIVYGGLWLFGCFTSERLVQVACVAGILCFQQQGRSGSAVSRTFFERIPELFILACALEAFGFWAGVGYCVVVYLTQVPKEMALSYDD